MKIPTFEATLSTSEDGITCISFVENPATQVDALYFSDNSFEQFEDVEKQMITSVVMLADTKIYRYDGVNEYYIYYSKDTLKSMCEKMLSDKTFNVTSLDHNGVELPEGAVTLVELYCTDEYKKSPFNVPEGSIIATYKINSPELWDEIKNKKLAISLEGYFTTKNIEFSQENKMETLKSKIKSFLEDILGEEEVTRAKASRAEVTETNSETFETQEDAQVESEDEPVAEVTPEVQETTFETETNITPDDSDNSDEASEVINNESAQIANLSAQVEALVAENNQLKESINNILVDIDAIKTVIDELIKTPAPAIDEFEVKETNTNNKWARLGSALS